MMMASVIDPQPETESVQLWIVVCENFHTSFGPFGRAMADRVADKLNSYSTERNQTCRYRVIPIWMEVVQNKAIVHEAKAAKVLN